MYKLYCTWYIVYTSNLVIFIQYTRTWTCTAKVQFSVQYNANGTA